MDSMIPTTITAAALAAAALTAPAQADSTETYCVYAPHDHTINVLKGPCRFSQYGTNTGAIGAKMYITLPNGVEVAYDGRNEGLTSNAIQLASESVSLVKASTR